MSALNLEIKTKLDELYQALLTDHPTMPTLLRDIHRTLKAQPEQVTLMTEDEIQVVVQGLKKQTNTVIVTKTARPTAAKKVALKNVSLDDLGF